MAQSFDRFELVRKGYEPAAVEQQLRQLNLELARLNELSSDLQNQLKNTRAQLAESESALAAAKNPNFAALGAIAANILSSAQQIAAELEIDAKALSAKLTGEAKTEAQEILESAQANYDSVVADGKRRAQRKISTAEIEAGQIRAKAETEAAEIIKRAEKEAARIRGSVATEVAAIRTLAKREIAKTEADLVSKYAAKENLLLAETLTGAELLTDKQLSQLEAVIAERRAEAEEQYLTKHQEAVAATEQYLASATSDLQELTQTAANLRFEIETLELEASMTQRRIIQEARDKADALVLAAEIESRELVGSAGERAKALKASAEEKLVILQNQAAAVELYLQNLRSLVTEGLLDRDVDGAKN